jgi:hypothetical protein
MSEWITDRLPTREDASLEGDVWITDPDGEVTPRYYKHLASGRPWHRIHKPAPYVNPKTWTLRWNVVGGCWLLENKRNDWVVLSYLTQDEAEAAQQIEDIYNKSMP